MSKHPLHSKGNYPFGMFLLSVFLLTACQKASQNLPSSGPPVNSKEKTNASAAHIGSAVATDWYKLQVNMLLHANPATNGALNAEAFAYIGIALYESVRSGIKNSISLSQSLYQMPQMPQQDNNGYDLQASANAALATMVRSMYPWLTLGNKASVDSLENAWNQKILLSTESEKFKRSQDFGRAIAAAVFAWSKSDNYNVSNTGYVLPTTPIGVYVPTPPAFGTPVLPFVSLARPFVQQDGSGVAPPPPFVYSETPGSDFYKMVKDLYDVSKTLTTEQRNMALFWNDQGVNIGYTPQGHMMNVATQAIEQSGVDLGTAAEGYAKAGIAIRESQLTCFRSKYQYLQMRPVSYIRKVIDPSWSPLITTPGHPEYPAAHSYVTSATLRALAWVLGSNTPVIDHSYENVSSVYGAPRSYSNLDKVGEESGNSRRYGGIHYMPSIMTGLTEGRMVGDRVGSIKMEQ
jgi:hypothetical protein